MRMTSRNIFTFNGYVCYHATGETKNQWYRNVGLLNVQDKLVVSAEFNGIKGVPQSSAPYFQFNGQGESYMSVVFTFSDGSTHSVKLSECKDGSKKQIWS